MRSSRSRQAELERLGAVPFAHRGLHGGGRVENSNGAFRAAAEAGYGIELDVQLSRDGWPMVFHDDKLDRLTNKSGPIAALTADELRSIRLYTSNEVMPTLGEALQIVGARVPLLIEVKAPDRHVAPLCEAVAKALDDYDGLVGVMSFNPEVGAWFARRAPERLRGLVVSEQRKTGLRGRIERRLTLWRSRADFLAYDIRDLPSDFASLARFGGLAVYAWTVRTDEERARAADFADQIIFEMPPA
jgi:glycerophosphoryl diester phosphodiesterase